MPDQENPIRLEPTASFTWAPGPAASNDAPTDARAPPQANAQRSRPFVNEVRDGVMRIPVERSAEFRVIAPHDITTVRVGSDALPAVRLRLFRKDRRSAAILVPVGPEAAGLPQRNEDELLAWEEAAIDLDLHGAAALVSSLLGALGSLPPALLHSIGLAHPNDPPSGAASAEQSGGKPSGP
jgi:hypothetical protein